MTKMTENWLNFIGGDWVDAADKIEVYDPATDEVFATIARANTNDVERAVAAARRCVNSGVLTDCRPVKRAEMMSRIADEIRHIADEAAPLLARENGKSLNDAREEFLIAARYFDYYGGMADKIEGKSIPLGKDYIDFTYYEPVGISAQIVPWNFPVDICARSLAPALAAGNAVIVKSPEITPLAMTWLATACKRAGLPDGALSILCGPGREVGNALVSHPDINQIVFTGSVPTGQSILKAAAENAIPSVMELGGKSAAVVFPDADIDQLLDSVRWGIFFNAGQVCSAMSRLLVHRDIYEEVVTKVAELGNGLSIGPGMDNAEVTPVVSRQQQQQILRICDRAASEGARLVTGGQAPADLKGYFIEPTVFADVTPEMSLFTEEVFGPVLAITPFDTEEEAWALANGTDFGLVAGVFTHDLTRAIRASRALRAGQVFVNEWYAGGVETPFGGLGLSGFGREKGQEALYSYVNTKNVAIRVTNPSQ
ncbi:aldehyde dehydrogenase family protein [Amphritea sp.]|uniref:aldehyde dehydrogenase family protein n=1 Tax=Amphritea sp. TaxID=1872502 RepID=UPI003A8D0896